jgi:hypothetical protein
MSDKKYVPKPLQLDSPVAERQLIFNHWVQTYNGLEDPIGLEGLDRLYDFVKEQLAYVSDGRMNSIKMFGEPESMYETPGFWTGLMLVSWDGQDEWGEVKYLHDGSWVKAVYHEGEMWVGRLQTVPVPNDLPLDSRLHVEVSREEIAQVPIGVILYAFATVFTVRAHHDIRQTPPDTIDKGWYYQSQLLRTAHALEDALLELYAKSNQAQAA